MPRPTWALTSPSSRRRAVGADRGQVVDAGELGELAGRRQLLARARARRSRSRRRSASTSCWVSERSPSRSRSDNESLYDIDIPSSIIVSSYIRRKQPPHAAQYDPGVTQCQPLAPDQCTQFRRSRSRAARDPRGDRGRPAGARPARAARLEPAAHRARCWSPSPTASSGAAIEVDERARDRRPVRAARPSWSTCCGPAPRRSGGADAPAAADRRPDAARSSAPRPPPSRTA